MTDAYSELIRFADLVAQESATQRDPGSAVAGASSHHPRKGYAKPGNAAAVAPEPRANDVLKRFFSAMDDEELRAIERIAQDEQSHNRQPIADGGHDQEAVTDRLDDLPIGWVAIGLVAAIFLV